MNRKDLIICGFLGISVLWSCGVLLSRGDEALSQLRGSIGCDDMQCENETYEIAECYHLTSTWPPNPETNPCNDPEEGCLMNWMYRAECPEWTANDCPCTIQIDYREEYYRAKQERRDEFPGECKTPDYSTEEYPFTKCKPMTSGEFACIISSCGGQETSTETISARTWCHGTMPP